MKAIIIACSCLVFASSAMAKHDHYRDTYRDSNRGFAFADVVNVEPRYQRVEHRVPEKQCWVETVRHEEPVGGYRDSHTGQILGAAIGGGLGNAVGHNKSNKRVGTVVGAILGASIANDMANNRRHSSRAVYEDVERCDVSYHSEYEERINGYDVEYRYNGQIYHTYMDRHPGKKIKVAVDVRPVY